MDHTYERVQATLPAATREATSMGEALEAAAAEWPDRTYFTFADTGETHTFAELNDWADRLAGALSSVGVGKGDRVGLYLENGPRYPAAIFACAKLGAIQTPINWQYREREVTHAVEAAEVSCVLVADAEYVETLAPVADGCDSLTDVVLAGTDAGPLADADVAVHDLDALSGEVPAIDVAGDDPFCIIYTSGTTGLPKPALLSHRSYLLAGKSFLGAPFPEKDVNYNPFPLFHGNNQFYSMTAPVLAGTEWVFARKFTASRFFDHVADYGVTSFNILGGTPKLLMATYDAEEVPDTDLQLAVGPIGTEGWVPFEETFDVDVVQLYSQTESPVLILNHPDPAKIRVGAIGMPMFPDLGHEVRLLDASGEEVPTGEAGELTRSDPGAMLGYYGLPEKTAETLREGVIYSGDIARRDADGYLSYVDRKKFMIRRSGENIAPREIENVIDELPGVAESAVIPVPDPVRGEEVKAMVKRVGEVSEADIVAQVAAHLAGYKVPRYVEFVESFPKTPSERIQRAELATAEGERDDHGWDREA